jgi:hypothetical protein
MSHTNKKFWFVTMALACLTAACALSYAAAPTTPATAADYAVNKRMLIRASAEEHAFVLTEMNDFMTSLHTINTAIANKDFETVAKTASAIANHSAEKPAIEVSFETKIPPEWKTFARPLRQGFGEVAQAAKQENNSKLCRLPRDIQNS